MWFPVMLILPVWILINTNEYEDKNQNTFAAVLFGTVFQSCLKDQADVFDDSPTVRMNAYLANAKKVLMKPEKDG